MPLPGMMKPPVSELAGQHPLHFDCQGLPLLFDRAALPLSRKTSASRPGSSGATRSRPTRGGGSPAQARSGQGGENEKPIFRVLRRGLGGEVTAGTPVRDLLAALPAPGTGG